MRLKAPQQRVVALMDQLPNDMQITIAKEILALAKRALGDQYVPVAAYRRRPHRRNPTFRIVAEPDAAGRATAGVQ